MSEVTAAQLREARLVIEVPCIHGWMRGHMFGEFESCPGGDRFVVVDHPLTLAALQAGAEERAPDYLAGQRFANRGNSGDWGLSDLDLAEVRGIVEAAMGDGAVVLVPRSE